MDKKCVFLKKINENTQKGGNLQGLLNVNKKPRKKKTAGKVLKKKKKNRKSPVLKRIQLYKNNFLDGGRVLSVKDGVAKISGLLGVRAGDIVNKSKVNFSICSLCIIGNSLALPYVS